MDETHKVTAKDIRETPWVQGDVEIPSLTLVYFAPDKDFFASVQKLVLFLTTRTQEQSFCFL